MALIHEDAETPRQEGLWKSKTAPFQNTHQKPCNHFLRVFLFARIASLTTMLVKSLNVCRATFEDKCNLRMSREYTRLVVDELVVLETQYQRASQASKINRRLNTDSWCCRTARSCFMTLGRLRRGLEMIGTALETGSARCSLRDTPAIKWAARLDWTLYRRIIYYGLAGGASSPDG